MDPKTNVRSEFFLKQIWVSKIGFEQILGKKRFGSKKMLRLTQLKVMLGWVELWLSLGFDKKKIYNLNILLNEKHPNATPTTCANIQIMNTIQLIAIA